VLVIESPQVGDYIYTYITDRLQFLRVMFRLHIWHR